VKTFEYERADDAARAVAAGEAGARYLGGGTNLVDLMREGIETPERLIDVTGLSSDIEDLPGGGLRIGGAARNTDVAAHPTVRREFPLLAMAIVSGASGQIRNMATVAGNLMQRTRCFYFYDGAARCNKRRPGSGCDAMEGFNRIHAILGASDSCVATHPSDMCVALAALDAEVELTGPDGDRSLALVDLHRLPGDDPQTDTTLRPGELITAITIPPFAGRSTYRKVRDRSSYAFALVSVAAAVDVSEGTIHEARLALGGVAHKPWRAHAAEAALRGRPATSDTFSDAAAAELADARPLEHNAFKIELARRVVIDVLSELTR
jgi:xanthine dehydrogenase YagS FAD-binding subunit